MCGKIGGRKNIPCFAYVPEPRKCLLVESGILGFEIRAQGIRNPSKYWSQESKTFLDYLIWGLSPPQRRGSKGHGASDCGNPKDTWGDMLIFNFCVRFSRESKLSRDLLSYALWVAQDLFKRSRTYPQTIRSDPTNRRQPTRTLLALRPLDTPLRNLISSFSFFYGSCDWPV